MTDAITLDFTPLLLLAAYSLAIAVASWLGGWLPSVVHMTHTKMQLAMSFVAGLILGVALYHLLPHSLAMISHSAHLHVGGQAPHDLLAESPRMMSSDSAIDRVAFWVLLGLVATLVLLRLFHFHQHDFSGKESQGLQQRQIGAHPLSWLGIAVGMGLHSLTEGVALSASVRTGGLHGGDVGLAGIGVFLAILLHKPLDALSVTSMMQVGGLGHRARALTNLAFSLLCPVGALAAFWGMGLLSSEHSDLIGCALAFAAGTFLCISLSDLLPEIHFHRHDRAKLAIAFLLGIGLAYALHHVEPVATHGVS